MLLFNARKSSQGFTLIEMLVIVAVIGILAATLAPSFLAWLNKKKVEDAVVQVQGALQTQRESMRKSKTCVVNVIDIGENKRDGNPAEHPTLESDPIDCLVTGDRVLEGITIRRSQTPPWIITFDFKGRTNKVSSAGTIFFSVLKTSTQEKCLVISQGLGLMRTGDYRTTASSNCATSR